MSEHDAVDAVLAQWRSVRPELDVRPMGYVGRLGRFARLAERKIEAGLRRSGLTIADFDVLASLRRSGPPYRLSPTELYTTLLVTSGTMTNRLDRLAERGLVERLDDPDDRRSSLVALTTDGRKLVDSAVEQHLENERDLLTPLSRAELATLDGLVRKLLAGLERPAAPGPVRKRLRAGA